VLKAIFSKSQGRYVPQLAAHAPEMLEYPAKLHQYDPKLQLDELIALANLARKVNLDEDVTVPRH
jgi:hypothetical protein